MAFRGAIFTALLLGLLAARPAQAAGSGPTFLSDGSGTDEPSETTYAPSAGIEAGMGVVYPTMNAPVGTILGRIGVAVRTPGSFAFALGTETGVAGALGTGATRQYGYLVRIPFKVFGEGIWSRRLDYRSERYTNFHLGAVLGPEFALAAQCNGGTCDYVSPGMYTGVGVRAGISLSQGSRSSVGLFVRWDGDIAQCGNVSNCDAFVQTWVWSVGWTLF